MSTLRRLSLVSALALGVGAATARQPFAVAADDLVDGGTMPAAHVYDKGDCTGDNRSPALRWRNPPAGTRSFAIIVFDPDAPGRGWWHWAVADIPVDVDHLPENASASGVVASLGAIQARNDFDEDGYGGPCPPPGKRHRYQITVYALKTRRLSVGAGQPARMFDHEIGVSALGSATLTVTYGR